MRKIPLTLLLLSAFIFFAGCTVQKKEKREPAKSPSQNISIPSGNEAASPYYNTYQISFSVEPGSAMTETIENVIYKNLSNAPVSDIYFNVYANSFSEEGNLNPISENIKDQVYPNGYQDMAFRIDSLTVNNENVSYSLNGSVLHIRLNRTLSKNEEVPVTMLFRCRIPDMRYTMGKSDNAMWFGSFFPVIASYENGSFDTQPYYCISQPLSCSVANYEVTIEAPADYTVIAPGFSSSTEQNGQRTTVVSAKLVRDFAFLLGRDYEKESIETENGLLIQAYSLHGEEAKIKNLLSTAKKSLDFYSKNIGSFPYQTLNLVETELYDTVDFQYPQMIFLDSAFFSASAEGCTNAVGYPKQYFNCIVGTDTEKDSYLHEGLAAFLNTAVTMSKEEIDTYFAAEYEQYQTLSNAVVLPSLDSSLAVYTSRNFYNAYPLRRSRLMVYSLYKKMGPDAFFEALQSYYASYSLKTATPSDFMEICSRITGEDYNKFFNGWIYNTLPPLF